MISTRSEKPRAYGSQRRDTWQAGRSNGEASDGCSEPFRTRTVGQVKKDQERPSGLKEQHVSKPTSQTKKKLAILCKAHNKENRVLCLGESYAPYNASDLGRVARPLHWGGFPCS